MKRMKKVLAFVLATSLVFGTMGTASFATEEGSTALPECTVSLIPGESTDAENSMAAGDGIINRILKAETTEINTIVNKQKTSLEGPQSALKFDRSSSADQKEQSLSRELYADNAHFDDPDSITVENAPEGYPFQFVGYGDYSAHGISKVQVIYERDETGNAIKDSNGNYVIKELQTAKGTTLTKELEQTTSLDGPFDQSTATRPLQFLLKNEAGDSVYAYCIHLGIDAKKGTYYAVANLEDNNYYATQDAEDHVRAIVFNGYWGTAEGDGSLDSLKSALKAAVAAGTVEDEYDIHQRTRAKHKGNTSNLEENQYADGTYTYTKLNEQVTLTDEVIDGLTEGEALDAMQAAIWSYANGSNATLNGEDGLVVGDLSFSNSQVGDTLKGESDLVGSARIRALYSYLINLAPVSASSTVINDKTFVDDLSLTIGNKVSEDIYEASINFKAGFTPNQSDDDLAVKLTYTDVNGEEKEIIENLTGEDAITADDNGYYTISGLQLKEGEAFDFTLNIFGEQQLERNAYIYTSESGIYGSQTMVGMAEGTSKVDVTMSVSATFATEASTSLSLKKVDEEGNALTGAEFTLTSEAAPEKATVYAVDENGELVIENLQPGSYTLKETKVPEGYLTPLEDISFDVDENHVLTVKENRYVSSSDGILTVVNESPVTVSGSKTWDDADNKDGIRPASIKINLLADGVVVETKEVTAEDGWAWTFADLDKYKDGGEIVYTITEDAVEGYTTEINGFDVTNTHVPEEPKELPPDEPVIDEPKDEPAVEEETPVVEEDPKELPPDENVIDEPEEDPKKDLPEDNNIIDEPVVEEAPDTGDHAPVMMLMLIAAAALAGTVTLTYKRR